MKRKQASLFSSWWRLDKFDVSCYIILIIFSGLIVMTASPAVAERIGVMPFYFIKRQVAFIACSILVVGFFSLLSSKNLRIVSFFGYIFSIIMLLMVLVMGTEIKGAKRWLSVAGITIQPSEIIKPFFIVISAWVLSKKNYDKNYPSYKASFFLYSIIVVLLLLQPDFGTIITNSMIWFTQLFLSNISIIYLLIMGIFCLSFLIGGYIFLPHVATRINKFLSPDDFENYQVKKSLEAYHKGKFFGIGPGEGSVKHQLPDSHTDFIFAVIGEELGAIVCIIIIFIFSLIIIRNFLKLLNEENEFKILSIAGILTQFGVQSVINIGVTLNLFPTKGMTLPFISYGGSSMITSSVLMGSLFALTKKKPVLGANNFVNFGKLK